MKEYVDKNLLKKSFSALLFWWAYDPMFRDIQTIFENIVDLQPAEAVEPVLRCKDCKYFCQIHLQRSSSEEYLKRCDLLYRDVTDEDFCSKGERAENGG